MKTWAHIRGEAKDDLPWLGTWLSSGSPVIAELASLCGFGWLLLDLEHGSFSEGVLLANLQAVSHFPGAVIVRVPTHEPGLVARVLDWGADGIMAPHVNSAEQARALVSAMRYPPHGHRGLSRTVRAYGYGLRTEAVPNPLFYAQIESPEAVRNVDEIAAVDGVDVLFVGPADLQQSLSAVAITSGAPVPANAFADALQLVISAANAYQKTAGILTRSADQTSALAAQGFKAIGVDSDLAILRKGFLEAARRQ